MPEEQSTDWIEIDTDLHEYHGIEVNIPGIYSTNKNDVDPEVNKMWESYGEFQKETVELTMASLVARQKHIMGEFFSIDYMIDYMIHYLKNFETETGVSRLAEFENYIAIFDLGIVKTTDEKTYRFLDI
jgi:hypothetical protein